MAPVVGAIFPISSEHIKNIFNEKKDVFIKYTRFSNLSKNSLIIFYISKEKVLFGRARIAQVSRMEPSTVFALYKNRLFLNENEFNIYSQNSAFYAGGCRPKNLITVFELKDVKKFKEKILFPQGLTPSGRYLSDYELDQIINY